MNLLSRCRRFPAGRLIAVCLCCLAATNFCAAENDRPNILLILTDDQSCSSLSCYGGTLVSTPAIDQLATEGVRLTSAYVTPQCTPTRAALLTGQSPPRNGMWHVIGWYGTPFAPVTEPLYRESLDPESCHMPHWLRSAGYRTGMAGKWHLTNNEHGHYTYLKAESADQFGFDFVAPPGPGSQNEGDKWVDHLTNQTIRFMDDSDEGPWFFYLAHHTLHGKVSAPVPLVEKYLNAGHPAEGMNNATYLAAIEHLDLSIGRILDHLQASGQADNTMIVFLSDNGGVDTQLALPQWNDQPLDGSQPMLVHKEEFDSDPLRAGKGSVYEGGIRVPCLVRWPGTVPAGKTIDTPVQVTDWLTTFLAAADVDRSQLGTDAGVTLYGLNVMPVLQGDIAPTRDLCWYMPLYDLRWGATPAAIIRRGRWKLIEFFGDHVDAKGQYRTGQRTELYDLEADLAETHNLAPERPELVNELRQRLIDWIRNAGAPIPTQNPHADPNRWLWETRDKPPWISEADWPRAPGLP
ncbi:sulfatase-like hydrolase/transferase [Crateriforma conspicua]|uniref:Arylsulfatase n=1 Tax=Crateriforma conspicua TaxID=2527996 RepID=A0A5C5Y821_9PLAN|nr:sulfatase-like hydrolase/transferase [Crateriforma conspicua]TWT70631.1 Arylsulfatase [Crateriforma conspicua]